MAFSRLLGPGRCSGSLVDRLLWPGGGGQRPEYPFRRGSPEGYYYPGGFTRRELRMGR